MQLRSTRPKATQSWRRNFDCFRGCEVYPQIALKPHLFSMYWKRVSFWLIGMSALILIGSAGWHYARTHARADVEVFPQLGHSGRVKAVAFSADGRLVLSGARDGMLKLWDVATGRELRTMAGHSDTVTSVAFSPDGRLALSGSADTTVKLWELATGREVRTLTGHSHGVSSVAFSSDGTLALSGGRDSTFKSWYVATGREERTLTGNSNQVWSIAFSPDWKLALSGNWKGI